MRFVSFNASQMDAAIWQFRSFETASLHYADGALADEGSNHVGLWDTTIDAAELGGEFMQVGGPS